jgi:prepilin peptidase CpaA
MSAEHFLFAVIVMLDEIIIVAVFPAALVAAAAYDLASFTIPNVVQIILLAAFAAFAIAVQMTMGEFGLHLLAGLVGLAIAFALFSFGFVGGGDAKLFACTALWMGLSDVLTYTLAVSVLGGLLTLGLLALRRVPLPAVFARQGWIMKLHDDTSGIPYGVALAAGALVLLPQTEIFRSAFAG